MQYCPKCGNKVDDAMRFCSNCGLQLKEATPNQASPAESPPNQTATSQPQKQPVHSHPGKAEHGFIGYLAGGLILVTIGIAAILELTNNALEPAQYLVVMLTVIGLIVIFSAFYVVMAGYRRARAYRQSLTS